MLMSGGARALDRARGQRFGAVGRWPAAQAPARRRGLRLCVVGGATVALAFAGVALMPLLMLAVAPALLGVPHVASDLRYLVVRRATLARRSWAPLGVAAVACTVAAAVGEPRLMVATGTTSSRSRSRSGWCATRCACRGCRRSGSSPGSPPSARRARRAAQRRAGAWLRLVPDSERPGERPIGYRHSLALLRADFGRGAPLVVAASLALPLAACVALRDVRAAYFTLAAFHGYLELAFVAATVAR